MAARQQLWWFVNKFYLGGAELGLLHLVEAGFFANVDLTIVTIAAGNTEFRKQFEEKGVTIITMKQTAHFGPKRWLKSAPWLAKKLRQQQPDILIMSLPQANIAGRIAVKLAPLYRGEKPFKRPLVISFEHNIVLAKRIYETLFRLTNTWIDGIFADCAETARVVKDKFYRTDIPTWIVPLLSFTESDVNHTPWQPHDPVKLLSTGRFTPVKNHICTIRALAILKKQGIDATYTLYGEGALKEELVAESAKLGVANDVYFAGFKRDWMSQPGDIFVLTSTQEGLCIVTLEAMIAGQAVVAPNIGGLKDYADPANTFLLPETTPEAVAAHIAQAASNPQKTAAMVKAQQQKAYALYNETAVQQELQRVAAEISALAAN